MKDIGIVIHGGAGTILKSNMTPEKEVTYRNALEEALLAGWEVLKAGGASLDAVTASVKKLEDIPLFNAGKGSVFTTEEKHEMDASIMEGKNLYAGSISGVSGIKNPILLARAVMEKSEHVYLSGRGAEIFAEKCGIESAPDDYFFTEQRYSQLLKAKKGDGVHLDHADEKKFGTVGAAALDAEGNLAAATSTGGMTNKKFGRVGDSAIIGSGNYANNRTCAVSCTGHGEYYIRSVTAYDVSCMMEYKGMSLKDAAGAAIKKLEKLGGDGGLIAIDTGCNITMPFNSDGMYRACIKTGEKMIVKFYGD
jgi:beta-aspartyl-peptidase (threonine type)